MKKLLYTISIISTKLAINLIKLSKSGAGTNLPGKIARYISPDILKYLVKQTKREIIAVTGTNGKTTTSGFIAAILEKNNKKIVHNRHGANMLTGLTTAVVNESNIFGKLHADNCVFEIDEAYLPKAAEEFTPDVILVTNLFRDQLDRYGELNTTAKKIELAINNSSGKKIPKIILNADDPLVSALGENYADNRIYYGFEEVKFINQSNKIDSSQETANCKCKAKFNYEKLFYGHIGHFFCSCGNKRPEPKISAYVEINVNSSKLIINPDNSQSFIINLSMPGLYNAYNALAAVTVSLELGIDAKTIINALENYSTIFGRAEKLTIQQKEVLIQLIKNPIGATEVLRTVKDDSNGVLLVIINDNYADGRDVSWLWDANFELLRSYKKNIIVSGTRASDMAVRLKYAGIESDRIIIIEDISAALHKSISDTKDDDRLYILPTYTALLALQKILRAYN